MLLQELKKIQNDIELEDKIIGLASSCFPILFKMIDKDFSHVKYLKKLTNFKNFQLDLDSRKNPFVEFKIILPNGSIVFSLTADRKKERIWFSVSWYDNDIDIEDVSIDWKYNPDSAHFGLDKKFCMKQFYDEFYQDLLNGYGKK